MTILRLEVTFLESSPEAGGLSHPAHLFLGREAQGGNNSIRRQGAQVSKNKTVPRSASSEIEDPGKLLPLIYVSR